MRFFDIRFYGGVCFRIFDWKVIVFVLGRVSVGRRRFTDVCESFVFLCRTLFVCEVGMGVYVVVCCGVKLEEGVL